MMQVVCLHVAVYFWMNIYTRILRKATKKLECVQKESLAQHRNRKRLKLINVHESFCAGVPKVVLVSCSQFMSFFTCVPPPPPALPPPLPLPPRGPALCWRRRYPGVSRLRWDSTPPGRDTAPIRTSFSSPFPVETEKKSRGQCWRGRHGEEGGRRAFLHSQSKREAIGQN